MTHEEHDTADEVRGNPNPAVRVDDGVDPTECEQCGADAALRREQAAAAEEIAVTLAEPQYDILFASKRFRDAGKAFIDVAEVQANRYRSVAATARAMGDEQSAEIGALAADALTAVEKPIFGRVALALVEAIIVAGKSGDVGLLLDLERVVAGRNLAEAGRVGHRYLSPMLSSEARERAAYEALTVAELEGYWERIARDLPGALARVDPLFGRLTPVDVLEEIKGKSTSEGVVAALACKVGALEYGAGDQEKAQRAIARACRADREK